MIEQNELITPTVGESLRSERIRQKLSTAQVARRLHMPISIIEDLEEDRINRLAPLYRRGYVSNYAALLGINPEPLLERIDAGEPPPLKGVLPVKSAEWKFEKFIRIATYVLATTVIIPPLIWFFVQGGSRVFERGAVDVEPVVAVPADSGRVSKRIAQALALSESEGDNEAPHLSASTVPLKAIRPARDPASDPLSTEARSQALHVTESPGPDPLSELRIELSEDSWVEIIAADGQRVEYDLLHAGTSRSYQGRAPFQVLLGRASAVLMQLDGEPVSFPGEDRADVTEFMIPPGDETRP